MLTQDAANDLKYSIPNTRVFTITFLGMTNHRPARVKILDSLYSESKIYSFPSGKDSPHYTIELALAILTELDINIIARAETEKGFFFVSDNFTTRLDQI